MSRSEALPAVSSIGAVVDAASMAAPVSGASGQSGNTQAAKGASTYRQILRSSALIGGSSMLNAVIGVARAKAMALMLGPAGFGLMAAFTTIADLTRSFAAMGINNSGVRQIAESAGSGDARRVARTITVLRRTAIVLGLVGALLLAVFSRQVAVLTFGDDAHWGAVALLSLAVFFRLVADGQGALLQGMRRIGDMAKLGVVGALLGSVVSVALVFWLREEGVAVSLVAVAGISLAASWWYSRSVTIEPTVMSAVEVRAEATALLRLGLAFMTSALLTMGAAYVVWLILIRDQGLHGAGLYQAAWAIGGIYVTFVLQAMGADFYPRLVAAAHDDAECNRLVNEQTHVSLLLAGAGVVATLILAPWVLSLLYSSEFTAATELLRWICLGMALRVITWPLGYVLVAKGKQALFIGADLTWTLANIGLTWLCVREFGLAGAGVAFFGSYLIHIFVVYPVCRSLSGFHWSRPNVRDGLLFVVVIGAVHIGYQVLSPFNAVLLGVTALAASSVYSLLRLRNLVGNVRLPKKLAWLARKGENKA